VEADWGLRARKGGREGRMGNLGTTKDEYLRMPFLPPSLSSSLPPSLCLYLIIPTLVPLAEEKHVPLSVVVLRGQHLGRREGGREGGREGRGIDGWAEGESRGREGGRTAAYVPYCTSRRMAGTGSRTR